MSDFPKQHKEYQTFKMPLLTTHTNFSTRMRCDVSLGTASSLPKSLPRRCNGAEPGSSDAGTSTLHPRYYLLSFACTTIRSSDGNDTHVPSHPTTNILRGPEDLDLLCSRCFQSELTSPTSPRSLGKRLRLISSQWLSTFTPYRYVGTVNEGNRCKRKACYTVACKEKVEERSRMNRTSSRN